MGASPAPTIDNRGRMLSSQTLVPLDRAACLALAERLGETPRTAMSCNALRNGNAIAFGLGEAYLVEPNFLPGEPAGYAPDATSLWALLQQVQGWFCVLAEVEIARALGPLIEQARGAPVRYYTDVLLELAAFTPHRLPNVRLLTEADLPTLLANSQLSELSEAQHRALIQAHLQAGAFVDRQCVALANVDAPIGRYAEIGVVTLEGHRRRGYSSAAASLIIQQLLRQGRVPLWSCGAGNPASIATANKLGFVESHRREYVIL